MSLTNTYAWVRLLLSQLSGFKAETGQQTHKHRTGRCYALHPALSADAAATVRPQYFIQIIFLILFLLTYVPLYRWTHVKGLGCASQRYGIVLFV